MAYELISSTTLSSSASTITLSSLPTSYQNIVIQCSFKGSNGYGSARLNNVTSTTYSWSYVNLYQTGKTQSSLSGQSSINLGDTRFLTGSAGGGLTITLTGNLDANKTPKIDWFCGRGNEHVAWGHAETSSATNTVNRIDILTTGSFASGSVFNVFGVA